MTTKRLGVALVVLAVAAIPAIALGQSSRLATSSRITCGVERWTVKTLQDRPRLFTPVRTTIHYLITRPQPSYLPDSRLPFERRIFTVTASVVDIRPEDDGDVHVILADAAGEEMIAEAPETDCTTRATLVRRRQMAAARRAVTICSRAVVTGVAFFDFFHGQDGVASNAIELHPILGFRCL